MHAQAPRWFPGDRVSASMELTTDNKTKVSVKPGHQGTVVRLHDDGEGQQALMHAHTHTDLPWGT